MEGALSHLTEKGSPPLGRTMGPALPGHHACTSAIATAQRLQQAHGNRGVGALVQRAHASTTGLSPADAVPPIVDEAIDSGGQPLDRSSRAFFEPRFGHDFSRVRVHTDTRAAASAQEMSALAYTVGDDIVFGAGRFAPATTAGQRLLAHELTHVVQQQALGNRSPARFNVSLPADAAEQEADRVAEAVVSGTGRIPNRFTRSSDSMQRACGPAAIGTPAGCVAQPPTFAPGSLFRFDLNCDDFASGQQAALLALAGRLPPAATLEIHGFASVDGPPAFNRNLACARALKAQSLLTTTGGLAAARITRIFSHGPTPGPAADRRSVTLRTRGAGHDLTAARFAGNNDLEDVYDGHKEIRRGSKGTPVRLIQESLLAQGYALPRFGADGDFGGETATAVRQFQIDTGAVKIDSIVGPETMGLLDMHDPGGTTATTGAPPPTVVPATGATFSESPHQQFAGYDSTLTPNALVVPVNGRREARAAVTPTSARPAFVSLNPAIAAVDPTGDGIVVTGRANGSTTVQAREGATVLGRLQIGVKARRDLTVDYHFMRDTPTPSQPPHHTVRRPSDAPALTSTLNRVWERQANVRFRTGRVDRPQVPTDLGPRVDATTATDPEWIAVTSFRTSGDYNVFLVWEFDLLGVSPFISTVDGGTVGSDTLLDDPASSCADGLTIAHEAGHFMGLALAGHPATTVMAGCGGAARQRALKAQADMVNP